MQTTLSNLVESLLRMLAPRLLGGVEEAAVQAANIEEAEKVELLDFRLGLCSFLVNIS